MIFGYYRKSTEQKLKTLFCEDVFKSNSQLLTLKVRFKHLLQDCMSEDSDQPG